MPTLNIPFPSGGVNTINPIGAMPITDCVYAYNVMPAENGGRARLGSIEWANGILDKDGAEGEVRTILPFTGSTSSGSNNKLFAITNLGIYDVTSGGSAALVDWQAAHAYVAGDKVLNDSGKTYTCATAGTSAGSGGPTGTGLAISDGAGALTWDYETAPVLVFEFEITTTKAGYGIGTVFVTSAGHFLCYFDEINGYILYTESTGVWTRVYEKASSSWASGHAYALGDRVLNDTGKTYLCITAGTSAGSGGPTGTTADITDNTVHWKYISQAISGVNPQNLVFGTSWKNRLWCVERDTTKGWYLDFYSVFGTATSFNFGTRFRQGGALVGLWSWTLDGGSGIDDKLVAISAGGDVVIYAGTDPSVSGAFALSGVWSVGSVPVGRRIATDFGGDLLVMSRVGVVPLSKLVVGNPVIDPTQYSTYKISHLFNLAMSVTSNTDGWSIQLSPEDNSLLLTIPTITGQPTSQLAMSLATRGWFQYRDLNIFSGAQWTGQFYFGTIEGQVFLNSGYVDNVLLEDPETYTAVQGSLLGAFSNGGNAKQKKVEMVRPTFTTLGNIPVSEVQTRYRFDINEGSPVTWTPSTSGEGTWDGSTWDSSIWSTNQTASQSVLGSVGMGPEFAIAVRFASTSRVVYAGADVTYREGGFL